MTKNVNIRFGEDQHARIAAVAAASKRSFQKEVEWLIELGLASEASQYRCPAEPAG